MIPISVPFSGVKLLIYDKINNEITIGAQTFPFNLWDLTREHSPYGKELLSSWSIVWIQLCQ